VNAALLPLLVAVPLLAAALTVLARSALVDRLLMVGVPVAGTLVGVLLVLHHSSEPVIAHSVGAFVPGVAIPFVSDTLTAVMLSVTAFTTWVSAVFLIRTREDRLRFLPALVLMLMGGVNGALLTGDLFNLFVFIEVMLLPSYALIAVTGTWRRLGIGRLFVLINLLTSTILLIGVGLVYGVTGTVTMAQLVGASAEDPRAALAVGVVLFALAIKAGVVPLHGWLPRSYPATSPGVMALFAGLHTKVAIYAMYRVYAVTQDGTPSSVVPVLAAVVVITILLGAVSTYGERRTRGVLAYQMVSGVGHILLGLVIFTEVALAAGIFYMAHHIITMGALLLTTGAIEQTYGTQNVERLSGLMRRDPWVAVVFALGLFSLVGLPPTSGLWGKVGLVLGAAGAGGWQAWVFIGAIAVASLASMLALQGLWGELFWGAPMKEYRPAAAAPDAMVALPDGHRITASLAAPGAFLLGTSVVMFAAAGWLIPVVTRASAALLDLAPYVEAVLG